MGWNVPYPEMNPEEESRWSGKPHYCPVCGDECEKVYIRRVDHTVVGCDQCLREEYADEAECMDD